MGPEDVSPDAVGSDAVSADRDWDETGFDSGLDPPAKEGPAPSKKPQALRLAILLVVGAVVVLAGTFSLTYLQEAGLRQAADALNAKEPDPEYALYLLDDFLQKHPESTRAMALKARTLVMLRKDPVEALRLFEIAKAADTQEQHAWAQALMMSQQWTSAATLLEEVLKAEPDNADALYEITTCRLRTGELVEARQTAEALSQVAGQEAKGFLVLGTIERDSGKLEQAREYFAKVLDYDPEATHLNIAPFQFFLDYGQLLVELNDEKYAEDAARAVGRSMEQQRVALGQPTPDTFITIGRVAMLGGRPENAAEIWQQALSVDNGNNEARELLANYELNRGEPEKALQWLSPVESAAVTSSISYLFQRCHELLQHPAEAEEWRTRTEALRTEETRSAARRHLLLHKPTSFEARAMIAYDSLTNGRNPNQAIQMFEKLAAENPNHAFVQACLKAIRGKQPIPPLSDLPIDVQFAE